MMMEKVGIDMEIGGIETGGIDIEGMDIEGMDIETGVIVKVGICTSFRPWCKFKFEFMLLVALSLSGCAHHKTNGSICIFVSRVTSKNCKNCTKLTK